MFGSWPANISGLLVAELWGFLCAVIIGPLLPRLLRWLRLERVNYSGAPLFTSAGLGFWAAPLPLLWLAPQQLPLVTALWCFGILGLADDRWGTAEHKGLRGHLGALRRGRITTGLLKAAGGLIFALLLAWWLERSYGALLGGLLIALTANFFNLLDLRPLRLLKVFWLLGLPLALAGSMPVAACLGFSLPYSRREARREWMLGDAGSNALGALVGTAAVAVVPLAGQAAAAVLLLLFHVWAEKHSLTRWIEAHSWARRLDGWGWRSE